MSVGGPMIRDVISDDLGTLFLTVEVTLICLLLQMLMSFLFGTLNMIFWQ
jgi:hypothetical protein